ncbi:TVP38/TMEM64 family protein [Spiribacter onubensis]|uniref:TVP38/TMEM64 family membrane protein n=1 Tax=Spiribacter onubensis TaxID=3122420 RepID=A0ABV3S8K7_9GAMM
MDQSTAAVGRGLRWTILAGVLIAIGFGVLTRDQINREAIMSWLASLGPWAGLAFVAAYAIGAVAFLPGLVFTIAGGALFGPVWGTVYSLIGATLGATLAFLSARHGMGDWVARRTGRRLERLQAGIDREGWRFVALMRLVPLVPFNLLNYALGLTRIRLRIYVATTLLAMTPGAFAYVWVGHAGRQAIAGGGNVIQSGLIAVALIAAMAFLPRLVRAFRAPALAADEPGHQQDRPNENDQ